MTIDSSPPDPSETVYDTYSTARRRTLLALVAAVHPLLPLTDTILLTQKGVVSLDLSATTGGAGPTATLSLYLLVAGVGFALWGPLADMYGRTLVYHAVLGLFLGSSVGCALAPTMTLFLVGRSFQGLAAAGTWSIGNAVVADIYPPDKRGRALGIFMAPGMLGPVVAPFIGAALTHTFGWRSMMWFLVILAGAAQLAVLILYRETQHHRVAKRLYAQCKQQQLPPSDWVLKSIQAGKPARPRARPLLRLMGRLLADPKVLPFIVQIWNSFGCMFLVLLQLTEVLMATTALTTIDIGLCYLATGVSSMAGSLSGGWAADRAAAVPAVSPTARVKWASILALLLIPPGLLLLGWTEASGWRDAAALAAAVAGSSALCFASGFVLPGGYSYVAQTSGLYAAGIGSLTAAGTSIWPAALMQLSSRAVRMKGLRWYNTALAALTAVLAAASCLVCWWQSRVTNESRKVSQQQEQAAGLGDPGRQHQQWQQKDAELGLSAQQQQQQGAHLGLPVQHHHHQ